ncbi:hypothetical protein BDDG_12758 [Blastomyces dermatitidis ATCC 18188]|uniref:CCHC-type domain-containing protein n=1 Tax=Ajellomyces dermatitidis (strain ATCC 18188 / CBS 674.68) TaxID=653446 RepID=A0A0J9EQP4_AJEDA|nr:hypothetical protein BDDG_12758 [Blastomyces dermatitidis ATCC 18188]
MQLYLTKLTHKVRTMISQYQSPSINCTELVNLASQIYLNNQSFEKKVNKTPSKQSMMGSKWRCDGFSAEKVKKNSKYSDSSLTVKKCQKRFNKDLCFNCRADDHYVSDCKKLKKGRN